MFNALLNILRNDGSIIINKAFAKNVGLHEAIIYSELLSRYIYFRDRNRLTEDGFFFNTIPDLQEATMLSEYQQRNAIKALAELGLIEVTYRGIPKIRHIKIVDDANNLLQYLNTKPQLNDTQAMEPQKLRHGAAEIKAMEPQKFSPNNTKEIILKNNTKKGGQAPTPKTKTNSTPLAKQTSLLDKKETKKQKKAREIGKMRDMILAFTTNQEVRKALTDYFDFRVGRGLTLKQWELILSDLREYAGTSASLAIEKIEHSLAGGYMTIIASWEKGKTAQNNRRASFDNTKNHDVEDLSEEERQARIEKSLARDADGNPIVF